MPTDNRKRRHVVVQPRHTGGVTPLPHGDKLMQQNRSAKPRAGLDFTMTAYLNVITQYELVFESTIMADMNTNHKEIVTADLRHTVSVHTWVDCYLFTNYIIVGNGKPPGGVSRPKAQYLRPGAGYAEREKAVILADFHIRAYHHIRFENGPFADNRTFANNAIRPDDYIAAQLYRLVNYRTGMYLCHLKNVSSSVIEMSCSFIPLG
jgi:hypothetical protein